MQDGLQKEAKGWNFSYILCLHFFKERERDFFNFCPQFPIEVMLKEQVLKSYYMVRRAPSQLHAGFILHYTTDLEETGVFIHICRSMFTLLPQCVHFGKSVSWKNPLVSVVCNVHIIMTYMSFDTEEIYYLLFFFFQQKIMKQCNCWQ